MEDLSVVLKVRLQELYKKKSDNYSVEDRKDSKQKLRKSLRHDLVCEKRKIPVDMSPVDSPIKLEKNVKKSNRNPHKRMEMLLKWKAEKEKKKQERKKRIKPVFKVTHVPVNVGLPDLENINKQIKGKPFKSSFAPTNHAFHPSPNGKTITFNNKQKGASKKEKKKNESPQVTRLVRRSQSRNVDGNENTTVRKTGANKKKRKMKLKQTVTEETEDNKNEWTESDFPILPLCNII